MRWKPVISTPAVGAEDAVARRAYAVTAANQFAPTPSSGSTRGAEQLKTLPHARPQREPHPHQEQELPRHELLKHLLRLDVRRSVEVQALAHTLRGSASYCHGDDAGVVVQRVVAESGVSTVS